MGPQHAVPPPRPPRRNPKYIDRNHGGTLIVWDRLFGTFGAERRSRSYGITKPLASWNPLWANLHYWSELWQLARQARRPFDGLRVLWKRPGWRPDDLGGTLAPPPVDRASQRKYDVPLPGWLKAYVVAQFALVNLGAVVFLDCERSASAPGRRPPSRRQSWPAC